jgi:hypothetical protein
LRIDTQGKTLALALLEMPVFPIEPMLMRGPGMCPSGTKSG